MTSLPRLCRDEKQDVIGDEAARGQHRRTPEVGRGRRRPVVTRDFNPSNFCATRFRYAARIVSGLTIFATSASACRPSRKPIGASVFCCGSVKRKRPCSCSTKTGLLCLKRLRAFTARAVGVPADVAHQMLASVRHMFAQQLQPMGTGHHLEVPLQSRVHLRAVNDRAAGSVIGNKRYPSRV